jgi:hypothetical protein
MRNITKKYRLKGTREKLGLTKECKSGEILRAPYKREFSSTTKKAGYNVKRGNKTVRVYPKSGPTLVRASCIKDKGLPGKGVKSGKGIGPLREGDLSRYGYNVHKGQEERHVSLKKAISVYGALSVFHKLTAVANLTLRTAPEAHNIFEKDRKWVQKNYTLKKD